MPDHALDLDAICSQVVTILVDTFEFPSAEATHRVNLWKALQHQLEGEALSSLLPLMDQEQQARELVRWVLAGESIDRDLRRGGLVLGLDLAE